MDLFRSSLFVLLACLVASEWTTDDGRSKAIDCFHQMMSYGDITNLLIDVTTPETIYDFCQQHADLLKCTRDNEHFMTVQESTDLQTNVSGVNNFYAQVCPPGSDITADFMENAACFKLIANNILYCGSNLLDVNSFRMKNDNNFRCCSFEQHRECIKKAARERCGNAAGDVAEKLLLRFFNRQIKPCSTLSIECEYSGDSTVVNWGTTAHKRGERYTTRRQFYPTKGTTHLTTEKEWTRETDEDKESVHPTEADLWKKHKHSNALSTTMNSLLAILACLFALIL